MDVNDPVPEQPGPGSQAELRRQLAVLWQQSQSSVTVFVWSMVANQHDAEDVIQNVAADAAMHFDRYDPARPFLPWVMGIARFKVIDYYRKHQRDPHVFLDEALEGVAQACVEVEPEMPERREALKQCVGGLSAKAKRLLSMRYDQGQSPTRIAEELDTTPGYIRLALFRTRTVLQNCVKKRLGKGGSHAG